MVPPPEPPFRRASLGLLFAAVALVLAACAGAPPPSPPGALAFAPVETDDEAGFALALVNRDRAAAGRRPLRPDPTLTAAAAAHAADMVARNYFAHVSPGGGTPVQRVARAGGGWPAVAENLAWCRRCIPDEARLRRFQAGWMASRGHRRNLLEPRITGFGYALAVRGDLVMAVQVFGAR